MDGWIRKKSPKGTDPVTNIVENYFIARGIIHLALGHAHYFEHTVGALPDLELNEFGDINAGDLLLYQLPQGWLLDQHPIQDGDYFPDNGEGAACARILQLILGRESYSDAECETKEANRCTFFVCHKLSPKGCADLRHTSLDRECLRTLGKDHALSLTRGTPLYSDHLEVFGRAEISTQS